MSIVKEFNLLLRGTHGSAVVTVLLASWLLQRVSVALLIRGESYGHEDPSRELFWPYITRVGFLTVILDRQHQLPDQFGSVGLLGALLYA